MSRCQIGSCTLKGFWLKNVRIVCHCPAPIWPKRRPRRKTTSRARMVEGAVSGRCRMPIDESRRPVLALSASTTLAPPITQKRKAKMKKDQQQHRNDDEPDDAPTGDAYGGEAGLGGPAAERRLAALEEAARRASRH